jgi:hypothetical protein
MTEKRKVTFFEIMVFIAYGFYILFGASWFLMSFTGSGRFNYQAFTLLVVFGVQAYYRHRLTNLILGVLTLFLSFFMLMDVLSTFNLMAKGATFDGLVKTLIGLCATSIIMSGILMFSYLKMSFKEA